MFTGCDSNSAFFGQGVKIIFDDIKSNPEAEELFKSCRVTLHVTKSMIEKLTDFLLRYIYNDHKIRDATEVRVNNWKSYKKKRSLAPDEDWLVYHITRGNHLAYIQRNYSLSRHPTAIGNGWKLNGRCYAVRHSKPNMSKEMKIDPVTSDEGDIDSTDLSSEESDDETYCDM